MTAYAGGPQIQNYLDPNRPDYGAMVLSNAENASALERALMQLNADVRGTELTEEARVRAAELGYQGASNLANAGTFAAGMGAIGQVAGAAIGAIPTGAPIGVPRSSPKVGIPGSVAPKTKLPYYGPAW